MTSLDVVFRYASPPAENELRAVSVLHEVYGIRRVTFDQNQQTVRVEYDASRLSEATIAGLLRRAGIDVEEKVTLA